jgi:hypothetical protein
MSIVSPGPKNPRAPSGAAREGIRKTRMCANGAILGAIRAFFFHAAPNGAPNGARKASQASSSL